MKLIVALIAMLLASPATCPAFDFKKLGDDINTTIEKTVEKTDVRGKLEEAAGIDLGKIGKYLNWETIDVSFQSDMLNTTDSLGHTAKVKGKVYKQGITAIRVDVAGEVKLSQAARPVVLNNIYVLRYPLEKVSYLVFPAKKTYMETDPEQTRKLLGQFKERIEDRESEIEKRELQGTELVDGRMCDKVNVVMTLESGVKCDIHAWLAKSLNGFPVKIDNNFSTPRGVTGINRTVFTNIEKKMLDSALFDIPEDYQKCKNFVQLATGGKFGSRLKKPKKRRPFKR